MTPAELEAIRRRNWDECADDSMDIATSDRAALLAHVDALQAERDAARAEVERLRAAATATVEFLACMELEAGYIPPEWASLRRQLRAALSEREVAS